MLDKQFDKNFKNFTYKAIDLGITSEEISSMLNEVESVKEEWRGNEYRGCAGLPVFGDLVEEKDRFKGKSGKLDWTPAGKLCPTIQKVYNEKIRPILDQDARINILKTYAGNTLHEHVDCQEKEIGTTQHKLRVVLQGEIDKLYFRRSNGSKWYVPNDYHTYVMDGGHLHALEESKETKITMCIGAPWKGAMTPEYEKVLDNSPYEVKVKYPKIDDEHIDPRFKNDNND